MLTMTPLGETLREERRRAGLTQGELSERSGVGITTIVRIERGQITEPRVSTLRKLAESLGTDTRHLLSD